MRYRSAFVVFLTCLCVFARSDPPKADVPPELQAALDRIRASSLRGDLFYIASDELAGARHALPGLGSCRRIHRGPV